MYGFVLFGVYVIVFALHIIPQDFYEVAKFDKRTKLEELMQDPERDPKERTLIFVQTKKNADFLATYLSGEGLPTTSIHGDRCVFVIVLKLPCKLLSGCCGVNYVQASKREGGSSVRLPHRRQANLGGDGRGSPRA